MRVRGFILCAVNRALGMAADDPDVLRACADYLDRHQAPMVKLVAESPDIGSHGPGNVQLNVGPRPGKYAAETAELLPDPELVVEAA